MSSEISKGQREVYIFKQFLLASKLKVTQSSVRKCNPPKPDIFCIHEEKGEIAFELVEICDSRMAESIANNSEKYIRTSDPTDSIIRNKLCKSYQTDLLVGLLCYVDGRVVTPDNMILAKINLALNEEAHNFFGVWLLGRKGHIYNCN